MLETLILNLHKFLLSFLNDVWNHFHKNCSEWHYSVAKMIFTKHTQLLMWIVAEENWSFGSFENEVRQFAGDTPTLTFLLWVSKQDLAGDSGKYLRECNKSLSDAENIIRLF